MQTSIITSNGVRDSTETSVTQNWAAEYAKRILEEHRTTSPIDHPNGSVTTAKIADGSVTTAKLASDVTSKFTELQENIYEEESARAQADTALGSRIDLEASARNSADAEHAKVYGTSTVYGHVRLSDDMYDSSDSVAATPELVSILRDMLCELLSQKVNKSVGTTLRENVHTLVDNGEVVIEVGDIGVVTGDTNEYYILAKIDEIAGPHMSYDLTWERLSTKDMIDTELAAEAEARAAADTTLQTNIDDEAAARASADTTLQTNINSEAASRESADTTLGSRIDTEAEARASADAALSTRVTVVEGKAHTHDNKDVLDGITEERVTMWDENTDISAYMEYVNEVMGGALSEIALIYSLLGVAIYDGGLFTQEEDGDTLDGGAFDDTDLTAFDCGDFEPITAGATAADVDGGEY